MMSKKKQFVLGMFLMVLLYIAGSFIEYIFFSDMPPASHMKYRNMQSPEQRKKELEKTYRTVRVKQNFTMSGYSGEGEYLSR